LLSRAMFNSTAFRFRLLGYRFMAQPTNELFSIDGSTAWAIVAVMVPRLVDFSGFPLLYVCLKRELRTASPVMFFELRVLSIALSLLDWRTPRVWSTYLFCSSLSLMIASFSWPSPLSRAPLISSIMLPNLLYTYRLLALCICICRARLGHSIGFWCDGIDV
jgi:hypothetical protein